MVLAGGFGSRLKSVVSEVPKPLAPVGGQPFLKYIIDNCLSQGVSDIEALLGTHLDTGGMVIFTSHQAIKVAQYPITTIELSS